MKTRWLVLAGVAAALLGGSVAWLKSEVSSSPSIVHPHANPNSNPNSNPNLNPNSNDIGAQLLQQLAAGSLPTASGASSRVIAGNHVGKQPGKHLTVINFWGTWCPPCVEEIPELNALAVDPAFTQYATMVGIAIDNRTNVDEFLKKTPISYPHGLAGLDGSQWMAALGNKAGGLPFTVILDAQGKLVFSKAGKTNREELTAAISTATSAAPQAQPAQPPK